MCMLLLLLSHFSHVWLCETPQPTRLCRPWDSPGKNTGVGCHFLLQCIKEKSESEVAQSCPTLSDPMDCSPPGSSVHGIFQARVLEWGAIAFSENVYSWCVFRKADVNSILNVSCLRHILVNVILHPKYSDIPKLSSIAYKLPWNHYIKIGEHCPICSTSEYHFFLEKKF